jgi:alkaline phosphatase
MDDLLNTQTSKVAGLLYKNHPETAQEGRGDYLPKSTEKAMQLLSKDNSNGFFMMIEGSQIDWENHNNNYLGLLAEMDDFNATINKVLDFARADGNTLVVVTADHETGGLVPFNNDTLVPSLNVRYVSFDHTPVMVPVFAFGPGAEEFCGIYKNTDVQKKIVKLLFK